MIERERVETYPALLLLPSGPASLVPGMAVYMQNGKPIDVDVTIPPDLENWSWCGTWLHQDDGDGVGVNIDTSTFGLPGTFEQARLIEKQRQKIQKREPQIVQLTLL